MVPAAQFCTTISSRTSNGNGSSKTTDLANPANSPQQPTDYVTAAAAAAAAHQQQHSNGNGNGSAESSSGGSGGVGVCARLPQGTRERFVFFRGVQWAAPDINTQQLSQALMTLWPTQFPKSNNGSGNGGAGSSSSSSPLVAHAGVAGIAQVGRVCVCAHCFRVCLLHTTFSSISSSPLGYVFKRAPAPHSSLRPPSMTLHWVLSAPLLAYYTTHTLMTPACS